MSLINKAMDFVDAIRETREFNELRQSQSLIDKNPTLKKKMVEIKRKRQEILSINKPRQEIEAKILEINEELNKLSEIPEINRYLLAGKNFNSMISKIFKTITDSIGHDLNNK